MEGSNGSDQNPNPNTKNNLKKQGNAPRFTTSVNRSESLKFYEDFIQKCKETEPFEPMSKIPDSR